MATTADQIAALQRENNQMYRDVAREQMSFQREMSNTAHFREVQDLISAGLNPVLSATGGQGASTPNGAQAEVDSSSMVSYLINEMNNENAQKLTNAQVAAQKYAADQAVKAAQIAANAQMYAADAAARTKPLGAFWNLFTDDENNPVVKAARALVAALGCKKVTDESGKPKLIYDEKIANESKFIKNFEKYFMGDYSYRYQTTKWFSNNLTHILQMCKEYNWNAAYAKLMNLYGIGNH